MFYFSWRGSENTLVEFMRYWECSSLVGEANENVLVEFVKCWACFS